MIPTKNKDVVELLNQLEERKKINHTYNVDWKYNQINGTCKDKKALEHSIFLRLNIERLEYRIYSDNFGVELQHLIGMPKNYVKAELPRLITDALIQDERIKTIDNFEFKDIDEESMLVEFIIHTDYGDMEYEKTVIIA